MKSLLIQFLCIFVVITALQNSAVAAPLILTTFAGPLLSTPEQNGFYDLTLQEMFRRINKTVVIVQLPPERSITNTNDGVTDGDFVRIAGLDRLYHNLVVVPEKITDFEFVAFSKNLNSQITTWKDLRPFHVGIVRGWKILEENITGTTSLTKVKNLKLLFRLLANNRIDIAVYSRFEGLAMARKLAISDIKMHEPALAVREMFLYLNKKHIKLVPKLTKALRQMKTDGTFEQIKKQTIAEFLK